MSVCNHGEPRGCQECTARSRAVQEVKLPQKGAGRRLAKRLKQLRKKHKTRQDRASKELVKALKIQEKHRKIRKKHGVSKTLQAAIDELKGVNIPAKDFKDESITVEVPFAEYKRQRDRIDKLRATLLTIGKTRIKHCWREDQCTCVFDLAWEAIREDDKETGCRAEIVEGK